MIKNILALSIAFTISGMTFSNSILSNQANAEQTKMSAKKVSKNNIETVFKFSGAMPTGVTVSKEGRIFVNYPKWGDPVPFTVGEIKNGKAIPFPSQSINTFDKNKPDTTLVSVQSVVVAPDNKLWILDTGSIKFQPVIPKGAKLVCVDLSNNKVVKTIVFPADVALPTTYLNDIRFDLRKGSAGVAYITDSAEKGSNAIIVVDLGTGKSSRHLVDHPSTKAVPKFLPIVEGKQLMKRKPGKPPENIKMGSDGIAISADGSRLYYCPLASRNLYSVSTDALLNKSEDEIAASVRDEGKKAASDGLESDSMGRIYVTDYEHNSIARRSSDGKYQVIAQSASMLWPDTMSLAENGYLYFTANQLHRQPDYQNGKDLRKKPYSLFRVKVDAKPVKLNR